MHLAQSSFGKGGGSFEDLSSLLSTTIKLAEDYILENNTPIKLL